MTETPLDPEDQKLITLARAARANASAAQGAAVRDDTGRNYAAVNVALPSLRLSALQLAVAMAASSGASRLEAGALVADDPPSDADAAAVGDLGAGVPILVAGADGVLRERRGS